MCGIISITRANAVPVKPERIESALNAMAHRGPDGSGTWFSGDRSVALGHARLSLISPADGTQPLASEDGNIHAVINGEFYGFEQIRSDLENKGHQFTTGSDSEIAVHLYEEHGTAFLRFLRGEFALVLWDERQHRLIAARDRFGIKPLNYCERSGELLLASEAKALFAAGVAAAWDSRSFMHAVAHQYLPPHRTFFEGVSQVPPAHFLIWEPAAGIKIERYWEPGFPQEDGSNYRCDEDGKNGLLELLEDAVRVRLRSDAPVAFAFSGGLDSSAVVAIASKQTGKEVPCYSVSFDDHGYDELSQASQNAPQLGGVVHPVHVTRMDLIEHLANAVHYSEGLAINGQLVGKYLLSRAVHDGGFKAILGGEGADEACLGYAHLEVDHYRERGITESVSSEFARQNGVMLPSGDLEEKDLRVPDWLGDMPTFLKAKLEIGQRYRPLLNPDTINTLDATPWLDKALAQVHASGGFVPNMAFATKSGWLWTRMALANYILRTLGDGAEMAHSVEGRLPFLDHHFFERAASLPVASKITGGETKVALRQALKKVVPEHLRRLPKHPFLAPPILKGGQSDVVNAVRDLVRSQAMEDMPFFDSQSVTKWVDGLAQATDKDRALADPALTMVLSSLCLQSTFKMGNGN